jgi:precorrin-2/cobalt-factor-2 C20-methyltransferase
MKLGILYGIGIGPGDPDLVTVKGAAILGWVRHVFVPKSKIAAESLALSIAGKHINTDAEIHEVLFPMTKDETELQQRWDESARRIAEILKNGHDAAFVTIGDALLYSTYIYCIRALRRLIPHVEIVTVPGVTSFCAAAAAAEFPIGEGADPVMIIPAVDDLERVRHALGRRGTLVLMKVGNRLGAVVEILKEADALEKSVFVSHAGMDEERIETDLGHMDTAGEAGYLSIILTRSGGRT